MKIENWEQIDADMQRGYSHAMANESVQACIEWKKTWSAIVAAMDSGGYASTEEFDEDFPGLQCVFNWASDYEIELLNAVAEDISFARERLSFCTEYFDRVADKDGQNSLNTRSAIANSYFRLGMAEDGEKQYMALTSEDPTWGWGWVHWSDEYSYEAKDRDYGRAIDILSRALDVDGIDERYVIKERLKEAYEDCGMHEEANSVVIDEWDYGIPLSEIGNVANAMKQELDSAVNGIFGSLNSPERTKKVGRNEPCPCGSGKKYKKCCGF